MFHRFGWREEVFAIMAENYPGDMLFQKVLQRIVHENTWQLGDLPPAQVERWTYVLDDMGGSMTGAEFVAKLKRQDKLLREALAIEKELQAAFDSIPSARDA